MHAQTLLGWRVSVLAKRFGPLRESWRRTSRGSGRSRRRASYSSRNTPPRRPPARACGGPRCPPPGTCTAGRGPAGHMCQGEQASCVHDTKKNRGVPGGRPGTNPRTSTRMHSCVPTRPPGCTSSNVTSGPSPRLVCSLVCSQPIIPGTPLVTAREGA